MDEPGEAVDTQMWLEQALIAVRESDRGALEEFRNVHLQVHEGIRLLMERQYGEGLRGVNAKDLGDALFSFYWGARLIKLLAPESDPTAQLKAFQVVLNRALTPSD